LTKGVHLVIDRRRLAVRDAVIMTEGNRILFAIPWGQRVILGTTDTDYAGLPEDVRTLPEDIRYILDVVNAAFPAAAISEADIISTWAGLRPLIADSEGHPSDVSRAHEIRSPEPGWWDVAGGKLTTYRLIAEQTINRVEEFLDRRRSSCRTAEVPLLEPGETEGVSAIVPPALAQPAVEHYCRNEWAVHLDDVMVRRGGWHYYLPDARERATLVARWMGQTLGWDSDRQEQELQRYLEITEPVGVTGSRA
jgi:glycerol-3-phosphate dehydrogenase